MKNITILFLSILFLAAMFVACELNPVSMDDVNPPDDTTTGVEPCREIPNCIPDLTNWKLHYKPYNADCTKCHTSCTPTTAHTFCSEGDIWNVADTTCLGCHSAQHQ